MNILSNGLPASAPIDLVMPQSAQLWMNVINWLLVAVVLAFAVDHWLRRRGSAIGIWLLMGGALTALNEPIVDVLGKCWFPAIGSWVLVKAWGVSIPVHLVPVYAWYVGGQSFLVYRRMQNGLTSSGVFWLAAAFAGVNILLEVPGLNLPTPMYSYFGDQPFVFLKFPLWWTFCNAMMPMVIAAVVFRCQGLFTGLRRPLIVPLVWMAAGMTNAAIAMPTWLALNLEGTSLGVTRVAATCSFGMSLLVCYIVSAAVSVPATVALSRNRPLPVMTA